MFYSLWLASLTSKCKETLLTLLTYISAEIFLFKKIRKNKDVLCLFFQKSVGSQMGSPIVHHDHYVRVCQKSKFSSLTTTAPEPGEGDGTPLQYSCLENPMDGGAWWAAVHGVAGSQTRLSDFHFSLSCIGKGNGNPLQCSCLENPRDSGAWWTAVNGVAESRTQLKQLSSSKTTAESSPDSFRFKTKTKKLKKK